MIWRWPCGIAVAPLPWSSHLPPLLPRGCPEEGRGWWRGRGGFLGMRKAYLSRSAGNDWMWTASPERDYGELSLDLSPSSGVREQSSVFSLPGPISQASISVNLCVCVSVWDTHTHTGRGRERVYWEMHGHTAGACSWCSNRDTLSNKSPVTFRHQQLPRPIMTWPVLGISMAIKLKDNDSLLCCIDKSH